MGNFVAQTGHLVRSGVDEDSEGGGLNCGGLLERGEDFFLLVFGQVEGGGSRLELTELGSFVRCEVLNLLL